MILLVQHIAKMHIQLKCVGAHIRGVYLYSPICQGLFWAKIFCPEKKLSQISGFWEKLGQNVKFLKMHAPCAKRHFWNTEHQNWNSSLDSSELKEASTTKEH